MYAKRAFVHCTWERVWRRESSPRLGRISLLLRKTTRRLGWSHSRETRLEMNTRWMWIKTEHGILNYLIFMSTFLCFNYFYVDLSIFSFRALKQKYRKPI